MVFDHILELIPVLEESKTEEITSSHRKTLIIYTASIVEALLLYKLRKHVDGDSIPESNNNDKWKYWDMKLIYKIPNTEEQVIAGKRKPKQTEIKLEKMNFESLNYHCKDTGLIDPKLFEDIKKLKTMRNRLHIGGLNKVEKGYTKSNLTFAFSVAQKLKSTF